MYSKARVYGDARVVWLSGTFDFDRLTYILFQSVFSFVLEVSVRVHKRKATSKKPEGEAGWLVKRRRLVTSAASCMNGGGPSMAAAMQESSRLWTSKQSKEMELQKERAIANSHYLSHFSLSMNFSMFC